MPASGLLGPGPHPRPSANLAEAELPLKVIPSSEPWYRFHRVEDPCLRWQSNPSPQPIFRFDAPNREYQVTYIAEEAHGAFIETFGHNTGIRLVGMADLRMRYLSQVRFAHELRVVELTGPSLARMGADARLFTGDYRTSQQWALAFFRHPSKPDGIYYPARHDNERMCATLFDRVGPDITTLRLGTLADPARALLLDDLLETYGFGLSYS